jgi:thioesterase domain-containing protein/acyl carrier protein
VVFLTAWYALHHLGQIARGERVLVQAATGGVGLAAVQIARLAGAEIFATAGSAEKRDFLRALGITHVMDSRSLSFADEVLAATGGRGVDLVLNSLAGEAITKGLSVLAPHGRFLEIGKRDVYQDTRIGLRPFRRSLAMFAIDLPQVMRDHPLLTRTLIAEILERFAARKLRPLPHRAFSVSDAAGAFRLMAKAQHVGKIVVSMDDDRVRSRAARGAVPRFRSDGSYLISGGLGGFGLATAQWMADHGARCLVLAGRTGASTPAARSAVVALRRRGVRVVVAKTDVVNAEQVAHLFRRIATSLPPLRGVVHAAMVLDDGVLAQLDAERLHRVMAPKVHGAWNLHKESRDLALDFFVLFSSVSSIVGAPAQGNYVAANGFLDGLAHHRQSLGLPALAVNWGQLSEVGYVARHEKVERHLTRQGVLGISPAQALRLLGSLLRSRAAQVGVVRVDWQRWASFLPAVASAPRYAALVGAPAAADGSEAGRGVRDTLLETPADERLGVVSAYVREQVGRVLRTPAAKLDAGRPLSELGVDSLMAFELVNRIETQFGLTLPTSKLTTGATVERLAVVLLEVLMVAPAAAPDTPASVTAAAPQGPAADRILVLRAGGNRAPLFCVHPAGGLANIYQNLAEGLPADLPVRGLQSREIAQGVADEISIARLAADYATEIVEQQPNGPYRLLGFSLGGILALAVTAALEARGERVELLGVVDSDLSLTLPGRRSGAVVTQHIIDMYRTFAREFTLLRRVDPAQLEETASDLASRVLAEPPGARGAAIVGWLTERGLLAPGISPAMLERYFSLFDAHVALVEGFHPVPVRAPIVLWHRGPIANGDSDRVGSWKLLAAGPFEERTIEGGHYDILYPPLVARLAAELDEVLRRAELTSIPDRCAPGAAAYLEASARNREPSARSTPARRDR